MHLRYTQDVSLRPALCVNIAAIHSCFPNITLASAQAKGLADKAAGAAKDATGSGAGPLQGAAGDAKKAVGDLKQVLPGPKLVIDPAIRAHILYCDVVILGLQHLQHGNSIHSAFQQQNMRFPVPTVDPAY